MKENDLYNHFLSESTAPKIFDRLIDSLNEIICHTLLILMHYYKRRLTIYKQIRVRFSNLIS